MYHKTIRRLPVGVIRDENCFADTASVVHRTSNWLMSWIVPTPTGQSPFSCIFIELTHHLSWQSAVLFAACRNNVSFDWFRHIEHIRARLSLLPSSLHQNESNFAKTKLVLCSFRWRWCQGAHYGRSAIHSKRWHYRGLQVTQQFLVRYVASSDPPFAPYFTNKSQAKMKIDNEDLKSSLWRDVDCNPMDGGHHLFFKVRRVIQIHALGCEGVNGDIELVGFYCLAYWCDSVANRFACLGLLRW